MKLLLLFVACCFPMISYTQLWDTLLTQFQKKPGIDFNIETRNSLLLNTNVKFSGIKAGIRFGKKFKTGISFNWLRTQQFNPINYFYDDVKDTIKGYFKMAYWSIYTKFVYYKTKRWEYSIPLQIGWGNSWLQYQKEFSFKHQLFKKSMLVYEPAVSVQFKILKSLALSTNLGYRFVWHNNKNILNQLNGPIYVLNIDFLFDQFFFEAFPESRITHKFGPAEW